MKLRFDDVLFRIIAVTFVTLVVSLAAALLYVVWKGVLSQ